MNPRLASVPKSVATAMLTASQSTASQLHDLWHGCDVVSSGFPCLDALLPAGGVRRGSLIEWVMPACARQAAGGVPAGAAARGSGFFGSAFRGSGAVTLACAVACRLTLAGGARTIVVVDRSGWFYPPAVLPWLWQRAEQPPGSQVAASHVIVARPARDDDEIWAIDQALRCPGVAAVVAWPRATRHEVSGSKAVASKRAVLRRWQLAARASGAVGLFVRPEERQRLRSESLGIEARIAVSPAPGSGARLAREAVAADSRLLERRLRLELIGGAWAGGKLATAQPIEIVFDLMRGCEQPLRSQHGSQHEFRPQEGWRVAE